MLKEMTPIIVSIAALFVSYNSYVVSENQLSIQKTRVGPHFYVDEVPIYDENKKLWHERRLKIFNVGAPVANISTQVNSFYKVNDNGNVGEKWIPITGYYYASFPTGEPKGLLNTHMGYENSEKDFKATFFSYREQNADYVDIQLKHIIFISYLSFEEETKNVCFLDHKKIDCTKAKKYNKLASSEYVDLDGLTYKKLIKAYNSANEI